jgi:hypothetical protein
MTGEERADAVVLGKMMHKAKIRRAEQAERVSGSRLADGLRSLSL